MDDFVARAMMRHVLTRPTSIAIIKTTDEDPKEAVRDLRENDPDGYANLSEFLPLENYGK